MDKYQIRDLTTIVEKENNHFFTVAIKEVLVKHLQFHPKVFVDGIIEGWPSKLYVVKYVKNQVEEFGLQEAKDYVDQYWATPNE